MKDFDKVNKILEEFEKWCNMKNLTNNKFNLVVFLMEIKNG